MRLQPGVTQVGGWVPGGGVTAALIDYLIVAGGNQACDPGSGAGSGGNVQYAASVSAPAVGSYSVVVGGAASPDGPGGTSSFNGVSATGQTGACAALNGANANSYSISGSSLTYGFAGANDSSGAAARANSGNGGSTDAGAGAAGVVIIRYLTGTMTATGGTITTNGGYTIHTFTSNGTWQRTA
jgi:hypothetical protein